MFLSDNKLNSLSRNEKYYVHTMFVCLRTEQARGVWVDLYGHLRGSYRDVRLTDSGKNYSNIF